MRLGNAVLVDAPRLDHLRAMLVPAGIVQFCIGAVPDRESGTCLDDNVRALMVAVRALAAGRDRESAQAIGDAAIAFIERARRPDGYYHNMADIDGRFLDEAGSEDSFGRMVWACGVSARCAEPAAWRETAMAAVMHSLPIVAKLTAVHPRAYAALGLAAAIAPQCASLGASAVDDVQGGALDALRRNLIDVADALDAQFHAHATPDWSWWRPSLTWGCGRLPAAMFAAALATGRARYAHTGLRALEFLAGVTQDGDRFIPIGNESWYERGGPRAVYDQQPIEACAMVDAWLAAHRFSGDRWFADQARIAYEWFLGRNTERLAVAVPDIGACHDGLGRAWLNPNFGAESTLSYLHAAFAIQSA